MKLDELRPGSVVYVEATNESSQVSFQTEVVENLLGYIIVKEVQNRGEAISFASDKIICNLIYPRQDMSPYYWENVRVTHITIADEGFHKISSNVDGRTINRRDSYRLFIGSPATVMFDLESKVIHVTVKDVSASGFSFVGGKDIMDSYFSTAKLVFAFAGYDFSLSGTYVRKKIIDDNRVLFACRCSKKDEELERIIMQRQREKVSMRSS